MKQVFTVFCTVCGGPAQDIYGWVADRVGGDDNEYEPLYGWDDYVLPPDEPIYDDASRPFAWLNECVVYSACLPRGISKRGPCDDYGISSS